MYLIDTNVWLETLLRQMNSVEVETFLNTVPTDKLVMSDFTLHSIGVILTKLNKKEAFTDFVEDIFENADVTIVSLKPHDLIQLVQNIDRFSLDFDDAYQYTCAKKYALEIVTFDRDFNETDIVIYRPRNVSKKFKV